MLFVGNGHETAALLGESLADTYRLARCSTGEQGLIELDRWRPALLVSDATMPDMDGEGLARAVHQRSDPCTAPLVFLTTAADAELGVRLLRAGARDWLHPPLCVGELRARIDTLVATRWDLLHAREDERRYRTLVEQASDGILVADARGVLVEVNRAACELLGRLPEEVLGRSMLDFVSPEDHLRLVEAFGPMGEGRTRSEWWMRRRDGTRLPVELSTRVLSDGRWEALVRDISERRRRELEASRRESELARRITAQDRVLVRNQELTRAIVESATDAILTVAPSGEILSANPAAEHMFGYPSAELVGQGVARFLPPARGIDAPQAPRSTRPFGGLEPTARRGCELTAQRRDDELFPVHVVANEARVDGSRVLVAFVRDMTEQKRLEMELLQSQKMEVIGSLSGSIAHDFNNLLMGILACSRLTADGLEEGDLARSRLDSISAAARRGIALTRRLLAFSRRRFQPPLRPTSLDAVIKDNESMLRQLLGEDVELVLALACPRVFALADEGLLEQVLVNLLINARDAMPDGGQIEVTTRTLRNDLVLTVRDTGHGIPPEVVHRIFEPFFSTKGPERGTGLGLSTVKRIVGQLEGRLAVRSRVGSGTVFRISVPTCAPPAERSDTLRPVPAATPLRPGATVLLVEDERLVRQSLRLFLQGRGYRVLAAATPTEALRASRSPQSGTAVDLLVTDMVLPEMPGGELARRLRETQPGLRAIFMSGNSAEDLIEQGRLERDSPFLEKPFEMEQLDALITEVLSAAPAPSAPRVPQGCESR